MTDNNNLISKSPEEVAKLFGSVPLNRHVFSSGIASLAVSTCLSFKDIKPTSVFGQKFYESWNLLEKFIGELYNLFTYSESVVAASLSGQRFHEAFWYSFNKDSFPMYLQKRMYVSTPRNIKGPLTNFTAPLTFKVDLLLNRLRIWHTSLTKNGYMGTFWADLSSFTDELEHCLGMVPSQQSEDFFVKKKEVVETTETDNTESGQPDQRDGNTESSTGFDPKLYDRKSRLIEPLVRDISKIIFEASTAARKAPREYKPREPKTNTDSNQNYDNGEHQSEPKQYKKLTMNKNFMK